MRIQAIRLSNIHEAPELCPPADDWAITKGNVKSKVTANRERSTLRWATEPKDVRADAGGRVIFEVGGDGPAEKR